jgi:hypothetical protein
MSEHVDDKEWRLGVDDAFISVSWLRVHLKPKDNSKLLRHACFQHKHSEGRVFGQAVGDDATGGAAFKVGMRRWAREL